MGKFISTERFGKPQFVGAALLVCLLGQSLWLIGRASGEMPIDSSELFRIHEGLSQWQGEAIAGTPSPAREEAGTNSPLEVTQNEGYDPDHSPLWYLMSSVLLQKWRTPSQSTPKYLGWLMRLPSLALGLLLGASLWYVARRLYGNAGGYVALTLYCFSPGVIRNCSLWFAQPETGAAWGSFGAVFTAIAVAHTLYAPREVVLWNWRRILLLALSFVLAVGTQFSLAVLLPVSLAFMLYVAPTRKGAALVIWSAAGLVAATALFAAYSFDFSVFAQGMRHAHFLGISWQAYGMKGAYAQMFRRLISSCPVMLVLLPAALLAYALWPRTRYFGNTAPLMVAILMLMLGAGAPHYPGQGFAFMALPFLLVFVAGISADLLESGQREMVQACVWGLLASAALWNLVQLARIGQG
jgi:hypothetical protein